MRGIVDLDCDLRGQVFVRYQEIHIAEQFIAVSGIIGPFDKGRQVDLREQLAIAGQYL